MASLHSAALADLLDLIQGVLQIESAADLIDDAVSNLLSRCLDCNYVDRMASEFHWLVHFGSHIGKFQEAGLGQMLPSCFVQERKRRVAKRYGQSISNTTKFEVSILSEVVCHELAQLEELEQFSQACRLVKKSVAPKKLATLVRQVFGSNSRAYGLALKCISHQLALAKRRMLLLSEGKPYKWHKSGSMQLLKIKLCHWYLSGRQRII